MNVTVVGCGNGAFAAAVDLTSRGHQVTLYVNKMREHHFKDIIETKIIHAYGVGPQGPIKIHDITCEEKSAYKDKDLIIVTVPSYAHENIALEMSKYIEDGEKILLVPGSTGGALVFSKIFKENSNAKNVKIAELHTLPYTARKLSTDSVNITLLIDYMMCGVFPSIYSEEMFEIVSELYPSSHLVENVLESSLNNGNLASHPAPMILNAGKIEYYGKHAHYREGITPSVANVIQIVDDERKKLCRAFGFKELDIKDRLALMKYCERKENLYDCYQTSTEAFLPIEGPHQLNHRYLIEDAPFAMVTVSLLGKLFGIETKITDSVIHLGSALIGEDFMKTGRTLEKIGLEGMDLNEINHFLKYGYEN